MATKTRKKTKGKPKTSELVIRRVFDAPAKDLWEAWTDPERFKQWFGPKGYTIPSCEIDLQVGGKYVYCMRSPDGKDFWATGIYKEVVPLRKIVSTDSFADEDGNVVDATYYGMPKGIPSELVVTVTFEDADGGTRMTLRHEGLPAGPHRAGASQGWKESFDKLAEELERGEGGGMVVDRAKHQTVMSRVFHAPRDRVFRAYTDPKLIPQWWGPRYLTTRVERMEVKKGGRWRFVQRDPKGEEFAFRGVYREIDPPERVVYTFEWEGLAGHVIVDTATFEDLGSKTRLKVISQFDSLEDLEGMLKTGMEGGANESYDRLEELLAATAAKRRA